MPVKSTSPISYGDPSNPTQPLPTAGMDDIEKIAFCLEKVGEGSENLAKRTAICEDAIRKYPKPGPDMIQYKPEGYEKHLNIKEVLDDLYSRLNKLEERLG